MILLPDHLLLSFFSSFFHSLPFFFFYSFDLSFAFPVTDTFSCILSAYAHTFEAKTNVHSMCFTFSSVVCSVLLIRKSPVFAFPLVSHVLPDANSMMESGGKTSHFLLKFKVLCWIFQAFFQSPK